MPDPLTLRWLRENVQSYAHRDLLVAHVDAALSRFPSLRPKTDVYTYDDGRTQLLLLIHGLLPITYRRASYHIPIAVWLTRDYPREPPIAYVVPTADMLVKPGRNVDVSGRATIEYLLNWQKKSEGCTLPALLDALQLVFSQDPPVYSKPKPSQSAPDYALRPPPPVPALSTSRPALPPKPPASVPPSQSPASPPRPPPPPPPHPPLAAPAHTRSPSVGVAAPPPPWHAAASPSSPAPGPPSRWSLPPAPIAAAPGQPPHYVSAAPVPAPATAPPRPPVPDLLDEDASADSPPAAPAPAPPAPPRPPNPELLRLHAQVHAKLSSELASLAHAMALDAERLRAHQADLLAGAPAIRDEMARLAAVRAVCAGAAARLRGTVAQAAQNVAALRAKGDPPVDELVCSTSIVHNQLVDLVADDNTIEDTIYHLHRALNAGRIDLDRFLRTTRVLAEEQFMKRALIEKIAHGLGARGAGWS